MGFPIYLVVAYLMVLVVIVELAILFYRYYQSVQCESANSAWCWNDWVCDNDCPTTPNPCYASATKVGLPSCLYGPETPSTSGCEGGICSCATTIEGGINCFAGCPESLAEVPTTVTCCTAANPC